MSYQRRYFSAIARRSAGLPHVIAYWLMSPWIAAHAASFIGSGIGKSGNPCARLIAPCWLAMRVISRMTDSVNVLARLAVAARAEVFSMLDMRLPAGRTFQPDFDDAAGAPGSELSTGLADVVVPHTIYL